MRDSTFSIGRTRIFCSRTARGSIFVEVRRSEISGIPSPVITQCKLGLCPQGVCNPASRKSFSGSGKVFPCQTRHKVVALLYPIFDAATLSSNPRRFWVRYFSLSHMAFINSESFFVLDILLITFYPVIIIVRLPKRELQPPEVDHEEHDISKKRYSALRNGAKA